MGAGRPDLAGGAPAPEHPPRTWPVCYARRNHGRIRSIRVETTSTHTQNGPVGVEGASVEEPARVFAGGRPAEGPGTGAHRPVGPQRLDPAQLLRDPAVVAAATGDPEPHHVGGGSASEAVGQCDLRAGGQGTEVDDDLAPLGGLGLSGLADRMSVVHRTFAVTSGPGLGTTLRGEIPLAWQEDAGD
jgi:hypothetical protein